MGRVFGLLRKQQVGLATIAQGMLDGTTVKHRVKRDGRFLLTGAASLLRGERPQVTTSKKKALPASLFTLGARFLCLWPERLCTQEEVLSMPSEAKQDWGRVSLGWS